MPHIPPEIIDIIIGFVANATFMRCFDNPYKVADISVLLGLSLVSRDWVFTCRRELFQRHHIVFNVRKSQRMSDFVEILRGRDQLPNIPHILSTLSTIAFIATTPCHHQEEQTITLLRELTKRKDFFQPVILRIRGPPWELADSTCLCFASSLIPAIAEAFATITHLDFDGPIEADCRSTSLVTSFKELRELNVEYWAPPSLACSPPSNEFLQTYRIPESLHTLQYTSTNNFYHTKHGYENDVERTVEWLQSHPPLPKIRRLSFVKAARSSIIQALVDICPDLNALCLSHWSEILIHDAGGVIDLSRHKQLARLCVWIPEIWTILDCEELIWNTVLCTVRTATSLRCSFEILVYANQVCAEKARWWYLLGEAVSALPKDVVLKVRLVCASRSEGKKGEDFIRKVFRDLSNHHRILFGLERRTALFGKPRGWHDFDVTEHSSTWKTIAIKDE